MQTKEEPDGRNVLSDYVSINTVQPLKLAQVQRKGKYKLFIRHAMAAFIERCSDTRGRLRRRVRARRRRRRARRAARATRAARCVRWLSLRSSTQEHTASSL